MSRRSIKTISPLMLISAALLAGCSMTTPRISSNEEGSVRAAAQEFTRALKAGDEARLRETTFVERDAGSVRLAEAVVGDTLTGRGIQMKLAGFADTQQKPSV